MKLVVTPAERLKSEQSRAAREALEMAMLQQLRAVGADKGLVQQHRFDPLRQWKADFAWPEAMLMLEVMGATFTQGRHTRGIGYEQDCTKHAAAVLAGWRVLVATGRQVKNGIAIGWIEQALRSEVTT